ncbi:hydroxyneurosporene dehydrogenase [Actinomycetes bacterium KLBMP 9797]
MDELAAPAALVDSDTDFARLGLDRESIAVWEDGARTDNRPGTYEWWYFDAHLDDGATLVVVFSNKDLKSVGGPLSPVLQLNLDLPDGRAIQKKIPFAPDQWSAATDHPDVRIGANRFQGDLREYRIQAAVDEVSVDVTLRGEVPPWRPGTGRLLFGPRRDREFCWLPSVPLGRVSGSYTVDGRAHDASGTGYHDHNWGNVGLPKIVHNWYWARGQAGPYAAIASYVTAAKRYGHQPVTVFMLARNGRVIADDAALVRFATEGVYTDDETGKPVATTTRYTYEHGDETIEVSFTRERDLARHRLIDDLTGLTKIAARLVGFDGAYLRFAGQMAVTVSHAGREVERFTDDAIWDLMYFGKTRQTP